MLGETRGLWRLALVFIDIALHRRGPEDLPASNFLFGLLLALYALASVVATQIGQPIGRAINIVILDTAFYLTFVYLLLAVYRRSDRFFQTASALLGTQTLLSILGIPILLLTGIQDGEIEAPNLGTWLFLLLIFWSIDIAGFILSRALAFSYVVGVVIVLVYSFGSFTLGRILFPVAN